MNSPILWHASRADISRPTLSGRVPGEDTHANSGLGLFCATAPDDYIVGFGPHVFEIKLVPNARIKLLTIGEFARLSLGGGYTWEDFAVLGRQWAQDYDCVAIEELDGHAHQMVILSEAAIADVQRHSREHFLDHLARVRPSCAPRARKPG